MKAADSNLFDFDVLICGAGASGLILAMDLARRGISFRLIDKLDQPFGGSRGKGLQPRTQEMLDDFGILDRVVATGGLYPPLRKYHADGSYAEAAMGEPRDPAPDIPYFIPLMIPQFLTERLMRERLAEFGHRARFGCTLAAFRQDADGVSATLQGPAGEHRVRTRYLIGADGGRSFVRSALQVGFPGKTLGIRAIVADVELTGLGREAWHQFNDGDMERMVAICPLAGTTLFQIQAPVPHDSEVDLSPAGLERLIGHRIGRDIRIPSVSWASAYEMNARLADRYRDRRVFLVGDAAHIHPPTGGQGLNTSVQDAYNLGWKLAAVIHGAPDRLLDTYEEERRPVAESVLGLSTRLLEAQKQGEKTRRGPETHQLDIAYPRSSLAVDAPARAGQLPPGSRAPDAPLLGAAGATRRLFELFAGPHWTLVGYEAPPSTLAPRHGLRIHRVGHGRELTDAGGYLCQAYGVIPGEWVLVRPDGYLAGIVPSTEIGRLESYFRAVGLGIGTSPEN